MLIVPFEVSAGSSRLLGNCSARASSTHPLHRPRAVGCKMVSHEVVDEIYERLLEDEETKDVEIEFCNGTLFAHGLILGVNSEPIRMILRQGINSAPVDKKRLSWREYTVEVGRFLLRLLYTGTVNESDWEASCSPEEACRNESTSETPLHLLLGALAIVKVYDVKHLIFALTEALKLRLNDENFNQICSLAIAHDVTSLRLECINYAKKPCQRKLRDGTRVKATRLITVDCAMVQVGTMGTVNALNRINWDNRFITRADLVQDAIEAVSAPGANRIEEMFQAQEFSPEVMTELSSCWALRSEKAAKRRRTL